MKLRNKKTGEIGEFIGTYNAVPFIGIGIDYHDGNPVKYEYNTLAELNEEWEDYTTAEPLIKDEKIRKAVRAWAEASGITKVLSYGDIFWLGFRSINTESVWKFECYYKDASEFKYDKEYTITELCEEDDDE